MPRAAGLPGAPGRDRPRRAGRRSAPGTGPRGSTPCGRAATGRAGVRSARVSRAGGPRPRGRLLGERDDRAVSPDALEGVVDALLHVLHVDDDVDVVEEHPPGVAVALTTSGLLPQLAPDPLLDRVDHGDDLAVVGRGAD